MNNITPLYDNVVIKCFDRIGKTESGLLLVESAKQKQTQGTVLSVGSGKVDNKGIEHPTQVKVGDKVIFAESAGYVIDKKDEVVLMTDETIIGVLENDGVRPLKNKVFVHNFKKGERKIGSIIISDDAGKTHGIRPRWAQVYAVADNVYNLKVGQWVLIQYGRWTHELTVDGVPEPLWAIEYPQGVIVVSDNEPDDNQLLDSMEYGQRKLPM